MCENLWAFPSESMGKLHPHFKTKWASLGTECAKYFPLPTQKKPDEMRGQCISFFPKISNILWLFYIPVKFIHVHLGDIGVVPHYP